MLDAQHRPLAVRAETGEAPLAPAGLFNTDNPKEVIQKAVAVADALMEIVRDKGWAKKISGRDHLQIEAWQTIAAMLGVSTECEWTKPTENGGWEARVIVRNARGMVIASAENQCTRDERTWKGRDDYALRSMAQTRATSKALRMALGFIANIAGFDATPAEEMPSEPQGGANPRPTQAQAPKTTVSDEPPSDAEQAEKRALWVKIKEYDADTRLSANDRMRLYMTAVSVPNRTGLKSLAQMKAVVQAYRDFIQTEIPM